MNDTSSKPTGIEDNWKGLRSTTTANLYTD